MRWRQAVALISASGAVFFAVFGLMQVIGLLSPGSDDFTVEIPPLHPDMPVGPTFLLGVQILAVLFLTTIPTTVLASAAWLAWRSDRRHSSERDQRILDQEAWGDQALAWWMDRLLAAGSGGAQPGIVQEGRAFILPSLAPVEKRWMGRFLARLEGDLSRSRPAPLFDGDWTLDTTWAKVLAVFFASLAALTFTWGFLELATQGLIEGFPFREIKPSAASVAFGLVFSWSMAAGFVFLAWGLHRIVVLNETTRRQRDLHRQGRAEKDLEDFFTRLRRLESPDQLSLASALAVATLEALPPKFQARLLERLYLDGRLAGDRPLLLTGSDLQGIDLAGKKLSGIRLTGVCFDNSVFIGADLDGAVLDGCSFLGARLQRISLRGASLRAANLRWAQCQKASFENADLAGVSFEGANLWGVSGASILEEKQR